ncbi:MAG TPA: 1-(5-phosphoribosyl)-5-[(5-phosphoribosylamino)methylideneamino]imidazole-4-carboxamide isomerase [Saprospiraceae bacterium]|nr:1-(5-phosphoribosyl)-5-[(5-phosphoribosylamino)methylideneamino]imidazole-4-carboxamide isomerase [Saprospiraceae bacterium]HQW24576.1 1-(5-phosphoribosyl)-5-[(5-phosphoribosylamino)methylideneamino]imidazole-4-carboxamide isomerase [Saprospiraceae bacterium]
MRIIPAMDILSGKCVRLTQGDYATSKVYDAHPVDMAKRLEAHGLKYLHLVDLDGARSNHIVNHQVLKDIASQTSLVVDFGGGIKSTEDIAIAFDNGANQITVGSIAADHPAWFMEWMERYGPEKIILGADSRSRMVATHGWLAPTGIDVVDFISGFEKKGVTHVICTDIGKDGMLAGPDFELYSAILAATPIHLIASGGIHSIHDLEKLKQMGCHGAIIGKAIYEGIISLEELSALC